MKVRTLWNRFRLFLSFQNHKRLRNYSPIVSLLFLTSKCNLDCTYCFAEHRGEFKDLKVDRWKAIIRELKKKGTRLIFLMGGEPLLYNGFEGIVDYVKSLGLECHVTTNGFLIPNYVDALKKADLVMVSLDGDATGNDANRGKGSFEKTTRGIEIAKENNIPLRINCVLTRNNTNDVEWLLDYGEKFGAYVGFTIPAQCEGLNSMSTMVLTDEEIIDVHQKLLKLQDEGKKITPSKKSLNHVLNYPKPLSQLIFKYEKGLTNNVSECCYGRYIVFIDAEGSIYPCTTLWENREIFQPKNIFRDGFDMALKNAQQLPCHICCCAGGIEWNEMSSFRGLFHALKFSMSQS